MKQRLPSRPKQALHIAFPYTNWGRSLSFLHSCPPRLNFKIHLVAFFGGMRVCSVTSVMSDCL